MRASGQGDRYTIWVHGRQSYLFFERSAALTGNVIASTLKNKLLVFKWRALRAVRSACVLTA